ncbi:MAG: arylesterase [Campylobacteraceae bacterium]
MRKTLMIAVCILLSLFVLTKITSSGTKQDYTVNQNSVVLAFGDSITEGFGVKSDENYPYILSNLLHVKVINAGVSGEISADGLKRLPKVLNEYKPNIVILCHGGNDILRKYDLSQTKVNLQQMITMIESSGAKVVFLGVPSLNGFFISTNSIYKELAQTNNLIYDGDIIEKIVKSPSLKVDQIHPNKEGHELLAQTINDLIRKNFNFNN